MARGKNPSNQAAKAQRAERKAKAWELRSMGLREQDIADQIGVAQSTVSTYVTEAFAELKERGLASAEEWRALELEKLDRQQRHLERIMARNHVAYANNGKIIMDVDEKGNPYKLIDDGPVMQAIEGLRKNSESRRKLLGLDQPTKIEQSGSLEVTTGYDLSKITDPEKVRQLMEILAEAETGEGDPAT